MIDIFNARSCPKSWLWKSPFGTQRWEALALFGKTCRKVNETNFLGLEPRYHTSVNIHLWLSISVYLHLVFFAYDGEDNGHCSGLQSTWRCEAMPKIHLNKSEWNSWTWRFMICFIYIWVFPKMVGFPPKSSILIGVFHYKPSILGIPLFFRNTHIDGIAQCFNLWTSMSWGLVAFIQPFLTNPKIR